MADRRRAKRGKRKIADPHPRPSAALPGRDPARRALLAVVILYLFVAASYATAIPLGRGPDETAHVRYLDHLADQRRLPVFNPADPDPDYEFHQPPLYYLIALPAFLAGGRGETGQQAVRLFTLMLSLPLIYLTFSLGRLLAPDEPFAAVAAAGVAAFLPMQLSVATTIGNDALSQVLAAATLLALVYSLRPADGAAGERRTSGPKAMVLAGALIGLGVLTKSTAVLLLPVAWLAAAFAAHTSGGFRWRQFIGSAAAATAAALAIGGWWLVRNHMLYGDPLAQRAFLEAFVGRRPSPQSFMEQYQVTSIASYIGQVMIWTFASITGVFGPVRANRFIFLPYYVYFATGLLAVAAAMGFARRLGRGKIEGWQRRSWWLCGAFALLLVVSFVSFNLSFFQAQARYLFPVLPAAAVAFALGLATLTPPSWRTRVLLTIAFVLAAFALGSLHLWVVPRFRTL